ncbi:MAG: hypothetical protein ACYCTY_11175 [Sulfuricella sp.]
MEPPGRRYRCASCGAAVLICSYCDRGQRYCAGGCSRAARTRSQREAGRRHQATLRGRHAHAARQRRYRSRQVDKVTHQGSPPPPPPALLPVNPIQQERTAPPEWHCHISRSGATRIRASEPPAQSNSPSFTAAEAGRARRPLMAFVMVLSWSRRIFLRFYLDARMENFLRGHYTASNR